MNQLTGNELKPAEFMRNVFAVTVPASVSQDKLTESSFWTHVAAKLHPTDRIEVSVETGEWLVFLYVVACGKNWAQMRVLESYDVSGEAKADKPIDESKFYWAWRGQTHKHCVLRKADKEVVKEGFDTKDAAESWIVQHEKTLALSS